MNDRSLAGYQPVDLSNLAVLASSQSDHVELTRVLWTIANLINERRKHQDYKCDVILVEYLGSRPSLAIKYLTENGPDRESEVQDLAAVIIADLERARLSDSD